ncbi:hypothetical protein FDF74_02945 [Clostridium niameyense]|uniref:Uncharacterized protein n=1 Tax=Clostridium niameyense TaxID=1622073 RepID=A0A6M0R8S3_9CLOT|nr:hypothetical protein [Clostridium niameyense]NEZ46167.1 hypothetical protein [Clostridium niameyense]
MKKCILNSNKICDNCGECTICDLDRNKKCNNCGKCLEKEGYDTKAIKINEIIQKEQFVEEKELKKVLEEDEKEYKSLDSYENNDTSTILEDYDDNFSDDKSYAIENNENIKIEYIDDVDGLSEIIQDEERLSNIADEEFPGLIKLKGTKSYKE